MFYSKSTGGFYDAEIHGDTIPNDGVEITTEQHATLFEGQSAGKVITADANGYPVLVDPPPVLLSVLIDVAKAKVRVARSNVFTALAGIQSQAIADSDMATAKQISSIQNKLKALPEIDLSACKSEADIEMAFLIVWRGIVEAAPEGVQSAFNGVFS